MVVDSNTRDRVQMITEQFEPTEQLCSRMHLGQSGRASLLCCWALAAAHGDAID